VEKIIYFFHRKEGLDRRQFFDHYLEQHTLIALRVARTLEGYTVNLTDDHTGVDAPVDGPDSITEGWTFDAMEFMSGGSKFDTEQDARELRDDDRSFIGRRSAWKVGERLVSGAVPEGGLRTRTPGVKRFSMLVGTSRPPAAPGVTAVVENEVLHAFSLDGPTVDRFVIEWAPSADTFAPVDGPSWIVSEYRQRDA
jgi:hypothetical protein